MKILPLLSVAIILTLTVSGCLKPAAPSPVALPVGNFTGTFTRLHLAVATGKVDTITAQLTLTLSSSSGFAVGGDTTHHAASHGTYVVDATGTYLGFSDVTYPVNATTPSVKTHLNGVYQYSYTAGSSLQIQLIGDTLAYYYNMTAH